MYCRVCGALLNDKAEICPKCGCRPLNGNEYCQECGAKTMEKQEICVKCGCRLKLVSSNNHNILDSVNNSINIGKGADDGELNLDFSSLDPYYQQEFTKIYESNETYKGKFNGWAFFFGGIWALTKGCWLPFVSCLIISFFTMGIGTIIYWFLAGFRGNYWYYCSYVKNKQCIL